MSKYPKMSEVFRIEVAPDDFHISPFCVNEEYDDGVTAHEYAAHAINSHDELTRQNQELLAALEFILERLPEPPEANCSCHISPPCNDCVDYGGEREAFEFAKDVVARNAQAKGQ